MPGLDILAIPLGWILWFIYSLVSNYFVAIFLFTLIVRAATFPLSLKSQKAQADRARLAPRLERLQKKYAKDPKKLQEKQMSLYEKEGISMTGGCLPMVIQMIVLFGIIAVIYSPLTHLARIPSEVVSASISAVMQETDADDNEISDPNRISSADSRGYYRELRLLLVMDKEDNAAAIKENISALSDDVLDGKTADEYYEEMLDIRGDFTFFGQTLLENPWNERGFSGINILWLIPLFSWLTAMGSSVLSMYYSKMATGGQKQAGQGCSNVMLLGLMPLFSLYITFIVPGGVGIYWICSNLIALLQTFLLNKIYNPGKIRAQAELEYEERRKRRAEDKKRLAEARAREEEEARRQAAEEKQKALEKQKAANTPKQPPASKNPNKKKRRENSEGTKALDVAGLKDNQEPGMPSPGEPAPAPEAAEEKDGKEPPEPQEAPQQTEE